MQAIIETYTQVVVQIATPTSTGTGFYLHDYGVIVTNEHVVRDNRAVVISGAKFSKRLSKVLFTDPYHDLAFLEIAPGLGIPSVQLSNGQPISVGAQVLAIGHPFGMKFSATSGIISNAQHRLGDIDYIQHDAALNPGNSGGPLVGQKGEVVGVNTLNVRGGDGVGFTLPVRYLKATIDAFRHEGAGEVGGRCENCGNLVFERNVAGSFCPHCGSRITLPCAAEEYEPAGIDRTIEHILAQCGQDVHLARRGPSSWEIRQGSANISIAYYEPNGIITGDAVLCDLPKKDIARVYEFLLRKNNEIEGLTLSVNAQDVVLSLIIYDRYLNEETGLELFNRLFQKADELDDLLVEKFGCTWKEQAD